MAFDTFIVYVGVYADVEAAEADYELIKDLHTEAGLIDAYDAAVVERRDDGKVRISRKHETPTRLGGVLGGGIGLATGLVVALFPFAGAGLVAATTAGGAGLVVVGVTDMGAKIEQAMRRAEKVQTKQLKADTAAIEADAREAGL